MSLPKQPHVVSLEWDDQNEQHVAKHVDPWLIEDMIAGGDWYAFPNPRDHPSDRLKFVGRAPSGLFVTVILQMPTADRFGVWRPVTGWVATDTEKRLYNAEYRRTRRHHG